MKEFRLYWGSHRELRKGLLKVEVGRRQRRDQSGGYGQGEKQMTRVVAKHQGVGAPAATVIIMWSFHPHHHMKSPCQCLLRLHPKVLARSTPPLPPCSPLEMASGIGKEALLEIMHILTWGERWGPEATQPILKADTHEGPLPPERGPLLLCPGTCTDAQLTCISST